MSFPLTIKSFTGTAFTAGALSVRLRVPAIGVHVLVVEGTSASALRAGAGHYRGTPDPSAGRGAGTPLTSRMTGSSRLCRIGIHNRMRPPRSSRRWRASSRRRSRR